MASSDSLRHQLIDGLIPEHAEKVSDAAVILWEQMAVEIISIVGEGGFNSLYARSVFLTQTTFPWLAACVLSRQPDRRFAELKIGFEAQAPAQARAANSLLLITFTDILVSLIGDQITDNILHSAWGDDASDRACKEFEK
ncbi:MAG: hypothetical protein ABI476_01455 [Oxalobacteraceae bacterium]